MARQMKKHSTFLTEVFESENESDDDSHEHLDIQRRDVLAKLDEIRTDQNRRKSELESYLISIKDMSLSFSPGGYSAISKSPRSLPENVKKCTEQVDELGDILKAKSREEHRNDSRFSISKMDSIANDIKEWSSFTEARLSKSSRVSSLFSNSANSTRFRTRKTRKRGIPTKSKSKVVNRIQKCNEISPKSNEKSSKDTKQGDESRQRSSAAEVKTILGAKYSLQTSLLPSEEAHISHIIDSKNEASGYNPENHLSKELSRIERNLCRIKSSEPTASLFRSVKDSSRLHDVPVKIYSTNISMEQLREEEYKWKATFDDVIASETIERSTKLQKSIREALSENQPEGVRNSEEEQ
eukprot:440608_1